MKKTKVSVIICTMNEEKAIGKLIKEIPRGYEKIVVDGEERIRVHHCPLASEWLEWSDPQKARLYCFVDQAKMKGFNPGYEYIHIKNLLDGDPYCELVVRPIEKEKEPSIDEIISQTVSWIYGKYTKNDLMDMEPSCLRALFRERIHHTIEVHIYPILLGHKKVKPHFGREPELILDVWRERGLPENEPDIEWGINYLEIAKKLRFGEKINLNEAHTISFSDHEILESGF